MKPSALVLSALVALVLAAPAAAQAPKPRPSNLVSPHGASLRNNPNSHAPPLARAGM
jgi:hypothetical protein